MWETVRNLRIIKNVLWAVIVLLGFALYAKSRNVNSASNYENVAPKEDAMNYNAVISASGGLRMRADANSNAAIIQSIPYYSKIFVTNFDGPADTIDEQPGNWFYATFNNSEGWIWGNYVSKN